MIVKGSEAKAPLEVKADVVVVGSGAGGALVAARLAQAGRTVALVEAGPHVTAAEMTQTEREMMPLLYHEAGLRQSEDGSIVVLHGRAVGGSTLVNYLDCFRTPDRLLWQWADTRALPEVLPERMAPRFARVEEVLHVQDTDESQLNTNNRKLKLGGERLGWKGATFRRNANLCYGSGFCDLGCAYNAKQSSAITWVPMATAAGATLYPETRIERVLTVGSRAVGVEGVLLGADRQPRGTARFMADLVVIAGGAVETPFLLLRSGVVDRSGQLGHNLWLHPATAVVGRFPGERVVMTDGIKQGWYISEFSWVLEEHPADVLLEGVAAPPGMSSIIYPGWGEARRAELAAVFNELAATGVLLRDHTPGRVEVGEGRPKVHYRLSDDDAARLRVGMARTAEAYLAAGASEAAAATFPGVRVRSVRDLRAFDDVPCGPGQLALFTFHQMGTARLGGRRDRDVCDPTGRLWAYDNLHVADSSLFPTASGVNPQLTVYGLAEMVAESLLARG